MLVYLLIYFIMGLFYTLEVAILHIHKATKMGYDLEIITDVLSGELTKESHLAINTLFGFIVYPIRIIQFLINQDKYFDMYDEFIKESK